MTEQADRHTEAQRPGRIDLNVEFTDEQLRESPYAAVMAEAVVVGPDEYRSGDTEPDEVLYPAWTEQSHRFAERP